MNLLAFLYLLTCLTAIILGLGAFMLIGSDNETVNDLLRAVTERIRSPPRRPSMYERLYGTTLSDTWRVSYRDDQDESEATSDGHQGS